MQKLLETAKTILENEGGQSLHELFAKVLKAENLSLSVEEKVKKVNEFDKVLRLEKDTFYFDEKTRTYDLARRHGDQNLSCKPGDIKNTRKLSYLNAYQTAMWDVYGDCLKYLGFKSTNRFNEDKKNNRMNIYLHDITKEGYALWLLPYHNMNHKKHDNYYNEFQNDLTKIKLIYTNENKRPSEEVVESKRLVFAKQNDGRYVFLGLFKYNKEESTQEYSVYDLFEKEYCCE